MSWELRTHAPESSPGPTVLLARCLLRRVYRNPRFSLGFFKPQDCIKVLLEPRSLFVLEGESRHDFTHAIRQSMLGYACQILGGFLKLGVPKGIYLWVYISVHP